MSTADLASFLHTPNIIFIRSVSRSIDVLSSCIHIVLFTVLHYHNRSKKRYAAKRSEAKSPKEGTKRASNSRSAPQGEFRASSFVSPVICTTKTPCFLSIRSRTGTFFLISIRITLERKTGVGKSEFELDRIESDWIWVK